MRAKRKRLMLVSFVLCLLFFSAVSCSTNDPVNATTGATKTK